MPQKLTDAPVPYLIILITILLSELLNDCDLGLFHSIQSAYTLCITTCRRAPSRTCDTAVMTSKYMYQTTIACTEGLSLRVFYSVLCNPVCLYVYFSVLYYYVTVIRPSHVLRMCVCHISDKRLANRPTLHWHWPRGSIGLWVTCLQQTSLPISTTLNAYYLLLFRNRH